MKRKKNPLEAHTLAMMLALCVFARAGCANTALIVCSLAQTDAEQQNSALALALL